MAIGIDWVSLAILLAAYAFTLVRGVSLRLRYGVFAVACAAIAVYRFSRGAAGANMVFVVLAAALAVFYGFRALQAGKRS